MDETAIRRAARLLAEARTAGIPLERLPADCRPTNVAEANAIGEATAEILNEPLGGWKISFVYKPRQVPWLTPLFTTRILDAGDGDTVDIPHTLSRSLCIEPEVTFRVTADLPPREAPYTAAEIAAAVIACPSFEVVDTRYDTSRQTIRQMIDGGIPIWELFADHQTSGAFVPGPGVAGWQTLDFREVPVTMTADGAEIVSSVGGHAFGDPFLPLVVLANIMRRRQGLMTGQLLATGSFTGFFKVEPGQTIVADFAGFGRVSARFAG
ncbi:MAG: hypothetical protein VW644_01035 [Alphaproteobacteria bacterium]|jgi:2-keto-4-pentenoate hydratase